MKKEQSSSPLLASAQSYK